jgi:hypothetical protein
MTKIEEDTTQKEILPKNAISDIWKKTPNLLTEKILYQLLLLKAQDKQALELDFYGGLCSNVSCLYLRHGLISSKQISFESFKFLCNVDRDFINLTKYENFDDKNSFVYKNINFDFDKKHLRELMREYVQPKDLDRSLVAGGFFSKYVSNNPISLKYAKLFRVISKKSDIDIYIASTESNHKNYELYKSLFLKRNYKVYDDLKDQDNQYKFDCFKIDTKSNETLNFIFLNDSLQSELRTNFDLINEFDMDLSKVFYSYHYDSVYAHVTFFKQFRSIIKHSGTTLSLVKDLRKYKTVVCAKKTYLERSSQGEFLSYVRSDSQDSFLNFLTVDLVRFAKYCFKGYYYDNDECEKYTELLGFFLAKFSDIIELKLESMHHALYVNFLLKKMLHKD